MTQTGGIAADQLKSVIERIERLTEEKDGIASDIRDVYAESKGNGYCTKTIRQVIKLRKLDNTEREEQESLLDLYKRTLNME